MNKLIIVGAGGLARMIYSWLTDFTDQSWEPIGFISDNLNLLDGYNYDLPIISSIREYRPEIDHVLVMAIADPKTKLAIAKELEERGARFITLIHSTAIIGKNVEIGNGSVICPRAILTCDIQLGSFVLLNLSVTIGHDVNIGNGCTINSHSDVTGCAQLGTGVFLGSHAVITPSVKVRDFAKIGAGSVAVKQVKQDTTVFGIPAKLI
ncbi:acetyltransferase [Neobacillus sp.]|uniref:acetyltransferase n=1 Tax=Neobacillus sp. TaxID=2675273 RepID=UPI002896DBE4|nr:acetyltransferase [Neobacillus sp.]